MAHVIFSSHHEVAAIDHHQLLFLVQILINVDQFVRGDALVLQVRQLLGQSITLLHLLKQITLGFGALARQHSTCYRH